MVSAVDRIISIHIISVSPRALNARGKNRERCLFSPYPTSNRIFERKKKKRRRRIIERRVDPPEKKPAIVMDRVIYI